MLGRVALRLFDNRASGASPILRRRVARQPRTARTRAADLPAARLEDRMGQQPFLPRADRSTGERRTYNGNADSAGNHTRQSPNASRTAGKGHNRLRDRHAPAVAGRMPERHRNPYLHKYGEAHALQDITIRGGLFSRVQQRDCWQFGKYVRAFAPDSSAEARAFARFVKYPYPEGVRLDSVAAHPGHISYYYSQEVPTDETSKTMLVTLQGRVVALDDSSYTLPPSDTLTYHVSSMLSFVDTTTRYKIKVINKYATVQDRNYIQFLVNDTRVLDTLGRNTAQLGKIQARMAGLIAQQEFFVDSVVLTATASPEGSFTRNRALAQGRAHALKRYLQERIGPEVDTLVRVRWVAEDWPELAARIRGDESLPHRAEMLELIAAEKDPDRRERLIRERYPADYRYLKESVYPWLRAVTLRYDLRRQGMIKDTIHTREVDTAYMRGVDLLQKRRYAKALYNLLEYRDRNTVVTLLSLGHDAQALEILDGLEQSATTEYLKAVACSRLGRKVEGREHFLTACGMDERMQYRGNLDPEITELLK